MSIILIILSFLIIIFKGLNYGIDFKGGTLIELRSEKDINISEIRSSLNLMKLGDVSVKEFGKKGDFLIKVEENLTIIKRLVKRLKLIYNKVLILK